MIGKRMMRAAIFNIFSHDCVVIDVPADVSSGVIANMLFDVSDIDARADAVIGMFGDILVDVGIGLVFVKVVALEVVMPVEAMSFCWPITALNCDRALQTWMPSYHV